MDAVEVRTNSARINNGVKPSDYDGSIGSHDKVIGRTVPETGDVSRLPDVNAALGN